MSCSPQVKSIFTKQVIKVEEKYLADQFFKLLQKNDQTQPQKQRFNLNSTNDAQIDRDILQKYYFQNLIHQYKMEGILSSSSTGLVFKAIQKSTQITFAIKIIPNWQLLDQIIRVKTQLKILRSLQSDKCIRMQESFVDDRSIYMVMDFMKYGTLHAYLLKQEQRLQEITIKQIMFSLFQGLMYIHSMGIIHRDLRPQNILIRDDASLDLVIGDFGQADYCTNSGLTARCGSLGFMAPEIMNGEIYNFQADVYSLGAICFMLFHGQEISQDAPQIRDEAKDFLSKCTENNPIKRITLKEALEHPWFIANIVDFDILEQKGNKQNNEENWLVNNECTSNNKVIPSFSSLMINMKH